jgi:hypothetical protein
MKPMKLLLAAAALAAGAQSAHAQSCTKSTDDIITSCDAAFSGGGLLTTSARGWCYLFNLATCPTM